MDLASALYKQNIAVRAGTHCAMPLLHSLGLSACLRISIACYTSTHDIDRFCDALTLAIKLNLSGTRVHKPSVDKQNADRQVTHLPLARAVYEAKQWDSKHRQLLLASKDLAVLSVNKRFDSHFVEGCESSVWIGLEEDVLKAFSTSKVIKGILAIILEKANSVARCDIHSIDYDQYFSALGLSSYFSQGRKDGLSNAVKALKKRVSAACE